MTHPEADDQLVGKFDDLPLRHRVKIYGVDYARWRLDHGGELYVTRFGWSRRNNLLPERWFVAKRFATAGERLERGTGTLYRVPTYDDSRRRVDLVVKFSRFGEEVLVQLNEESARLLPDKVTERWNDPFEEFGRLMELRRGRFGPETLRIRTKLPMAIYCPPEEFPNWQLGRKKYEVNRMRARLASEQHHKGIEVELHPSRVYVLLFQWVKGQDAEQWYELGRIDRKEVRQLTKRVSDELRAKGFFVLDNKPRHFILRETKRGDLLRRDGKLVYALIDFELLQRTEEYEQWIRQLGEKTSLES